MKLNRIQFRRLVKNEIKNILSEGINASDDLIKKFINNVGPVLLKKVTLNTNLFPEMLDSGNAAITAYSPEKGYILAEFEYGNLSVQEIKKLRMNYFIGCADEGGMNSEGEGNYLTMFICSESPGRIVYTG